MLNKTLGLVSLLVLYGVVELGNSWSMQPPNIKPLECGLQRETPLQDFLGSAEWSNGLTLYRYDTNDDSAADVQVFIPSGDDNRYPLFYSFDNTFNGEADITWIDKRRDGTCQDVDVYWYRGQEETDPTIQQS